MKLGAALLWLGILCLLAIGGCWFFFMNIRVEHTQMSPEPDGSFHTQSYYRGNSAVVEWEFQEIARPDGSRVRHGPATRFSPDGRRLEQGSFSYGKREGPWTFWHEDGTFDDQRSGLYENDVRVQAGPSPKGDFDDDPEPRGYEPR